MLRLQGILVKATTAIFFPTVQLFSQIFLTQSESSTSLFKFHSFHETKPAQNEVERLCHNLAEFVFEYLYDIWRNLVCTPDLTWYFITIYLRTTQLVCSNHKRRRGLMVGALDTWSSPSGSSPLIILHPKKATQHSPKSTQNTFNHCTKLFVCFKDGRIMWFCMRGSRTCLIKRWVKRRF